jgi:hypothetical protein
MKALTLTQQLRACTLSIALGAAALGITSAAFAGEETTWYDKWPEIQAQLHNQAADPPPARVARALPAPESANDPPPARTKDGFLLQDPYPPVLNGAFQAVDPQTGIPLLTSRGGD